MTIENINFGGYLLQRDDITKDMWDEAFKSNFGFIPGNIYTRINTDRKYEFKEVGDHDDGSYFLVFKEIDSEYEDDETLVDAFVVSMYFDRKETNND